MGEIRGWESQYFGPNYFKLGPLYKPNHARDVKEVDFILDVVAKQLKGKRVLDLACGHGRHSLELARRGFKVIGIDNSDFFLQLAREKAAAEKIYVNFQRRDIRDIGHPHYFNLVISMFTSFGYFSNDSENEKVIKAVAGCLRRGGVLILDLMNASVAINAAKTSPHRERVFAKDGIRLIEDFEYEEQTRTFLGSKETYNLKDGGPVAKVSFLVRLYTLKEIQDLLQRHGLCVRQVYGDLNTRIRFSETSPRMVIVAQKI